jgi:hypothetical protein
MEDMEDFAYLWEDPNRAWVLVRFEDRPDPSVIVNRETREALIIEDDDLYEAVIERMRKAGIETVDIDSLR